MKKNTLLSVILVGMFALGINSTSAATSLNNQKIMGINKTGVISNNTNTLSPEKRTESLLNEYITIKNKYIELVKPSDSEKIYMLMSMNTKLVNDVTKLIASKNNKDKIIFSGVYGSKVDLYNINTIREIYSNVRTPEFGETEEMKYATDYISKQTDFFENQKSFIKLDNAKKTTMIYTALIKQLQTINKKDLANIKNRDNFLKTITLYDLFIKYNEIYIRGIINTYETTEYNENEPTGDFIKRTLPQYTYFKNILKENTKLLISVIVKKTKDNSDKKITNTIFDKFDKQ